MTTKNTDARVDPQPGTGEHATAKTANGLSDPKPFSTAVVLSLASGRMLCAFTEIHEFAEYLVGGPVWTHQFAHRGFMHILQEAIYAQHPRLRKFDKEKVSKQNWMICLSEAVALFGPMLVIEPITVSAEMVARSFAEPLTRTGAKAKG